MDAPAVTPFTPSYTREASIAVVIAAAAANPSAGSFGFPAAAAPPSTGVVCGLFMPPRMTSTAGSLASAPAVNPRAPSCSSQMWRGRRMASVSDEGYMSTMGVGSNNCHWYETNDMHFDDHEFEVDENGEGIVDAPKGRGGNYTNDEDILLCNTWLQVSRDPSIGGDQSKDAYWNRMQEHFDLHNTSGIDRSTRSLRSRWSTINRDCQKWAPAQKAVDKLNPSGTNDIYRFNIAQNLLKGDEKKTKKGNIKKGRPFTLPHCYEELKDDGKWKKRDGIDDVDESNKRKKTIELDHDEEEASSDDGKRSPTPNSVSYLKPKRPDGCKKDAKEKKKRKGDGELKNAMEAIVKARKEASEVRKMARTQDAAAEERRLTAEERMVAAEERKVTLEERNVAMEERSRLLEWGKYLFFLDTSTLNEAQNEYINLTREEVLIQKRAMLRNMGGGGMGGMGVGGIGGMSGFGAPPGGIGGMGGGGMGGMGGMDGFGAPSGGMGGGGIGGMGRMDGFGASPGGIGGMGV
ncbi:Alternative oxidase 1a, mitochondrial [Hordeum vulgare]|nr:Alternative oxidase 1a, mitochondrial [Hordeum vulgare]